MENIKYCEGCGAPLQSEDEKKMGFIPSAAMKNDQLICKRCFRIKNYGEVLPIEINDNDFLQILNGIAKTDSVVIQIIDIFDIDGTIISGLPRFVGNNPYIVVANKFDLFPKSTGKGKIKHWLTKYLSDHGLHPEEIFLISAENNIGIEVVSEYIRTIRGKRDVYVVGATNVGKSTFINSLIKLLNGKKDIQITTSRFPGTTLNTIYIPLKDGRHIIDTPGVVHKDRYSEWVSSQTLKLISPNKIVKPKVYQLQGEQSLFLGGLARVDQLNNVSNSFVCYISNELNVHRTKLSKADELFENHLGELLSPPSKEEAEGLPNFTRHSFKLHLDTKKDIVISGLGWITIDGENTNVDVYVPKGIGVHVRDALI